MYTLRNLRRFKHLLEAVREQVLYRFPVKHLTVIGVTGTDGKTTTTSLIYHILTTAGIKTGISSTLGSAHTTTQGRGWVHRFLRQCLDRGCTHAVIEVTSIGFDQLRVWGVPFTIGVLTNIANNEHLDYHGTFEKYRDTKINFLLGCRTIVANGDDPSFTYLQSKITSQKLISYSLSDWAGYDFKTKLLGDFNKSNILAAAAVARSFNISELIIKKAVASFEPPAGRLEIVVQTPFTIIVDFAHTPQAFEKVLPVAKGLGKKLIHVFGATGNRDKAKRPIMAKIAALNDDYIFLTHEDTYSENPTDILTQLESGLIDTGYKDYEVVSDRQEAIKKALAMARPGDVVIITGVGHQRSMNIAGQEVPWNEPKIVKELLDGRKN